MEKMIESMLESIFEKVSRQKVKCTVHSPNSQKFGKTAGDTLRFGNLKKFGFRVL